MYGVCMKLNYKRDTRGAWRVGDTLPYKQVTGAGPTIESTLCVHLKHKLRMTFKDYVEGSCQIQHLIY